ncbi:pentatricopeptide repeat (PPR) superfamily protein [Artemisia annua]|uniref:Pentatricopeptide repeat (PPR) superfamily protein n=1 Tax=Artemisia annua TaxID=35608 RepID=A0A2U1KBX9_ARTAN|nr:pentatricopeptide repeat (PPR) superfamily protein [Artemisia annua]
MIYCKHSTHLLNTLKNQCKTIKQIHQTHAQIITKGLFSPNLLITLLTTFNNIITTTPECRQSLPAHHYPLSIFNLITNPSPFSYNTIIRTHTLLNLPENALLFFAKIRRKGVSPDTHTFPFVLKAIAMMKNESLCKMVHTHLIKFGFLSWDVFVCNNLVHVYCVCGCVWDGCKVFDESGVRDVVTYNVVIDGLVKSGEIEHGRRVFDEMGISVRDATTWGTMMAGYVQVKRFDDCLEIYDQMVELKVKPDNIALVAVLGACGRVGKLEKGKEVHEYIKRSKIRIDSFLCTALVDFYAKCGCIETAMGIFESSKDKNLFTWNAILVGFAMHGHGEMLLSYFSKMVKNRVKPDGVTFLGVLVGCSHAGLIDEARGLFDEMESVYGVPKELKHYGCMVDLLGRAGLIKEAIDMIENMPMSGDVFVWGSLLGGCRLHGNVEVAEKAAEHIMEISPEDGGVYSTMADIYANAKRWDDLTKIRSLRDSRRVNKNAGCSLIQLDGATHEFVAGDDLHPQTDEIYLVLNSIGQHQCELQL